MTARMTPEMAAVQAQDAKIGHELGRRLIAGYLVTAIFLIGILGYAAAVEIRGAVIAPGNMVVEGNIRRIQHQDGGSVAAILVHNGQKVSVGDLLVRMNETQARAERGVVMVQLYGQQVRAARLIAERDDAPVIDFPPPPVDAGIDTDSAGIISIEKELFAARKRARDGEISQLRERIDQIGQEIEGLTAQQKAVEAQAAVVRDELVGLEALLKQGLTQLSRINPQRLNLAQLDGRAGELKAEVARARGRISEINVQIAQVGKERLNEVTRDLRDASEKIADLQERRLAAEAKLQRIEIRAPITGTIHQMSVFTIGGVVAPGETVMQIVPENEKLLVESRIEPAFIDQVSVGQDALIRFSSFDQRSTPELVGRVIFVSADLEQDQRQQAAPYFRARVELKSGEMEKLPDQRIISGLPAELHLQTRERTILSYLLKPLTDQISRTFRER
ncbi:HlyD family type I secretion periplasmic adaptor subunit [Bradyrhizobium sp. LHD-71]|uniref:HlyD family type I secretion periplasmic adaptor subunit n=1 Tax=Bradyrhizobium sp. LHD-71 TaxID=3072141 RepID=UPI00280F54D9|nr:HlyD family type I secretion periplasmic adaptor subunit [Bradyrhizobium sp. LHD-71]MDQ8732123.1 HlyD family type I secretion periplasmic adaptor subunit [Bradyrhizobium sp. LHD-71]